MKTKNRIWLSLFLTMGVIFILANKCEKDKEEEKITDADGNVYTSVTIGTQVWMVENLKTTKYKDVAAIPNITDNTAWGNLTTPGYCWFNNDIANKTPYGALYNWYAVSTGKLCPTGWHVPSDAEFTTLTTFLGGASVAGGKLKETGTTHWWSPNSGATNETGFTALPGTQRAYDGQFDDAGIGDFGYWWSSTEFVYNPADAAYYLCLDHNVSGVVRSSTRKRNGNSVRCLKD
jgi:uncharacterized protein (TIGR02145 family)